MKIKLEGIVNSNDLVQNLIDDGMTPNQLFDALIGDQIVWFICGLSKNRLDIFHKEIDRNIRLRNNG